MKHFIYYGYGYPKTSNLQRMKLIKDAGFDGVFLFLDDEMESNASLSKEIGLDIQTVHLPFSGCNCLWEEGSIGEEYVRQIFNYLDRVKKIGVDTVILHTSSGPNPPAINELGISRITDIIKYCETLKIHVALENIRRLEYIDVFFQNIESDYLCFCFDCGHAAAFTKNIATFPWGKYRKYLRCLHLHDNDSTADQHLIINYGTIDYQALMRNLKQNGYTGDLTLEVVTPDEEISEADFVKLLKEKCIYLEQLFLEPGNE